MLRSLLVLLLLGTPALAQEPPAAGVVRVEVPLSKPKKDSKRAERPLDKALFDLWLPEDVATVRGVLVNPYYRGATGQAHWRAACRHWGFGIVATNYFGIDAADFATLDEAMDAFAAETRRPELANAVFLFVGMSAGGGMSTRLVELYPKRTVAACPVCLEVGPRDEASRRVPILTIFGERDGKQMEKLFAKLPEARKDHAVWALAVQWRRRHEFGQANNLAMPFFDAVLSARYPADADPRKGPVALKPADPFGPSWLGHCNHWETTPAPLGFAGYYDGDASMTAWLPNESVARTWQAFVSQEPGLVLKAPAGLGDGQTFVVHPAGEAIAVRVTPKGNTSPASIDLYAGDRRLLTLDEDGTGTIDGLPAGIHALHARGTSADGTVVLSRPSTIVVR